MSQSLSPVDYQLGSLKTSFGPNQTNARIFLYSIPVFVIVGIVLLLAGFDKDYLRDSLAFIGGGLFMFLVAAGMYFGYRAQLKMGVEAYDEGFVFTNWRNKRYVCRWDNVTEVYELITYREGGRMGPISWTYWIYQTNAPRIKLSNAIQNIQGLGLIIQSEVKQRLLPQLAETYQAGGTVNFGPKLSLSQQGIISGKKTLPWDEVANIEFSKKLKSVRVYQKGKRRPWLAIIHSKVANYAILQAFVNEVIGPKSQGEQPAALDQDVPQTAFPRGSIGDLSVRIGYDVRELLMAGYSMEEIHGILRGEYDVQELLKRKPRKRSR
jgi:hypothetical protein